MRPVSQISSVVIEIEFSKHSESVKEIHIRSWKDFVHFSEKVHTFLSDFVGVGIRHAGTRFKGIIDVCNLVHTDAIGEFPFYDRMCERNWSVVRDGGLEYNFIALGEVSPVIREVSETTTGSSINRPVPVAITVVEAVSWPSNM